MLRHLRYTVGMRIERIDEQAASEAELRAIYEIVAGNEREALPHWEPTSWGEFFGRIRTPLAWRPTTRWVARHDDGTIVGTATLALERRSANRDHADIEVDVPRPARRRSVGRALLRTAAEQARADACTIVDAMCREEGTGLRFAEAMGLVPKLRERRSGLRFDRLDLALLAKWATPVPGYELVVFEDGYPADWLERLARAAAVMNTAPLDDFEMEPEVITPVELDELQRSRLAKGTLFTTIAAVETATGEIAGYTELLHRADRTIAEQEDTGVWPQHRNRGLGRLLKAAMLLRVLERRPWVRGVETWNAGSNDAMLRINIELGFQVLEWWWNIQGPTEVVLARASAERQA